MHGVQKKLLTEINFWSYFRIKQNYAEPPGLNRRHRIWARPDGFPSRSLEREPGGNLYPAVSGRTARDERVQPARLERRDVPGVNVSACSQHESIRVVEDVERIRTNRQLVPFGEADRLHQAGIDIPNARAAEHVAFRDAGRKLIVVAKA